MNVGRWWKALAVALSWFLLTGPGLAAQSGGWRTDERVLITDFGIVTALARSPASVFAGTTAGLVVVDEAFGRLEIPVTSEDGYPAAAPSAMAYDRRDGSLWIAAGGYLLQFDPFSRRFRDRIPMRQVVTGLVPAERTGSDLFVRMRAEWWRLDTFSRDLRRADPGAVLAAIESRPDLRAREEALRDPFFLDAAGQAVRSFHTGPVRIFDVVPSRDAYGWWLATGGESLVPYDEIGRVGQRTPLGPTGSGMASVLATSETVWFAPESSLEGRYGVAEATSDLQRWRVWRADSSRAVPDLVNALHRGPRGTWAGGGSGLWWLGDGEAEWRQERSLGLSHVPVLSIAAASGLDGQAVWVGTARGLVRVMAPGAGFDVADMSSTPVGSVVESGGAVWIGTEHGLYSMPVPDSSGEGASAQRAVGPASLRSSVGALAAAGDTVFAGLDGEVWWKAGRDAAWVRLDSVGRSRARVSALAIRDGVLWVGSAAELLVVEVAGGVVGRYSFGRDLPPGPRGETGISDISIVSAELGWVAIPAGALRLEVSH